MILIKQLVVCASVRKPPSLNKTNTLPDNSSLGADLGIIRSSRRGVKTPSMFPNMEERPKLNNIMKNRMAQAWEPGMRMIA